MKFSRFVTEAVLALPSKQIMSGSTFSPARPPAVPLAVRSPYLNVWLNGRTDGGPSGYLAGQWPRFWTEGVQAWQGYVMVDGSPYNWMGAHPGAPMVEQQSLEYTSTQTIFTMNVNGKVQMSIKFLSPVYPDDLRRQSVTSSYLEVSVRSLDGQQHQVQVYADVSGEWASGDNGAILQWDSHATGGVRYHRFYRRDQTEFSEAGEIASWGQWYWATGDELGVSYQIGRDSIVRSQFLTQGNLTGYIDQEFRAVSDRWPVFALSRDLGSVGEDWTSTLFTIGYAQKEAILFHGEGPQPQRVPSLWTQFFAESDLVTFFYHDYASALSDSVSLDSRIARDSVAAAGQDYLVMTSLAVRQVFGALQYTGTRDKVLVFLKEISSNSDIQTVDVIYPALPILLYLNPELLRYVLEPLLENDRYHYPNNWAQHDLGTFPRALGHPKGDDEPMPLEECGNMIILMLAYAQRQQRNDYLSANWDLLVKWAGYLIEDAKIPAHQLSTDDFAGRLANQTNLAIKGIIALEAMSQIAQRSGHGDQSANYSKIARDYFDFWRQHGVNSLSQPKHSMLQYDSADTYGLLYNIYPDKVLGLGFVPAEIYEMQSDFYLTIQRPFGVVLDTRSSLTKLDWEMFAAAVASPAMRDIFVSKIASWINRTSTWRAFTDLYDTESGGYLPGLQFTARPVVGGVFSLLALPPA